jgi:hypothetical protein|nr:MAG TPA: carboxypeptidase [Caudoviricetes sp.]
MKIIDKVLNKECATKDGKESLIEHCCVESFGFEGDCEDGWGMCRDCWNKEVK